MKRAFLFPGQGAQYPGMGKDLHDHSDAVRRLFDAASDAGEINLRRLLFDGSEEDLKSTDNTQMAITLVNLAAATVLAERGITAHASAGFSLGEYASLVQAGVLASEDVFAVVRRRGQCMERASRDLDARYGGTAGMAAVLGLSFDEVRETLASHAFEQVYPAIHNSPVQTVVAGAGEEFERAQQVLKETGARRVMPLKVSGPFHTPLMESARAEFAEYLETVSFTDPALPVYSNVTGARVASGKEARELCIRQLVSPVLWVDEQRSLVAEGYDELIEVGPGTVLGGLWKAYAKAAGTDSVICCPAGTVEDIAGIGAEA